MFSIVAAIGRARRHKIRAFKLGTQPECALPAAVVPAPGEAAPRSGYAEDRMIAAELAGHHRWIGLAVGLGITTVAGLIGLIIYLLNRRAAAAPAPQQLGAAMPLMLPAASPPQVYLISAGGGASVAAVAPAAVATPAPPPDMSGVHATQAAVQRMEATLNGFAAQIARPPQPATMHTYALPNLAVSSQQPIRLAQATKTAYDVTLRVVGPAGSFAAFSTDTTELSRPDMPSIPTGNTVIIPSGQFHMIRLLPRQAVYGKGQAPNLNETVFASVTANEAGGRIYG